MQYISPCFACSLVVPLHLMVSHDSLQQGSLYASAQRASWQRVTTSARADFKGAKGHSLHTGRINEHHAGPSPDVSQHSPSFSTGLHDCPIQQQCQQLYYLCVQETSSQMSASTGSRSQMWQRSPACPPSCWTLTPSSSSNSACRLVRSQAFDLATLPKGEYSSSNPACPLVRSQARAF